METEPSPALQRRRERQQRGAPSCLGSAGQPPACPSPSTPVCPGEPFDLSPCRHGCQRNESLPDLPLPALRLRLPRAALPDSHPGTPPAPITFWAPPGRLYRMKCPSPWKHRQRPPARTSRWSSAPLTSRLLVCPDQVVSRWNQECPGFTLYFLGAIPRSSCQ